MSHNWNDGTEQYNVEAKLRKADEQISALAAEIARLTAELHAREYEPNGQLRANLSNDADHVQSKVSKLVTNARALQELVESAPVAHFRWCQDDAQGCDCPSRGWLLKRQTLLAAREALDAEIKEQG